MKRTTKTQYKTTKQTDPLIEFNSVSELNITLKSLIEPAYPNVKVSGEISNRKESNSHLFMTLKDNDSMINVISWNHGIKKNQIQLNNGDMITVHGKINHYPKSGSFSLVAYNFEKIGVGNLHTDYETLKLKYEQLGYFNFNKKQLPNTINKLGIITALEGAALQDILAVLKKNCYTGKVIIKGSIVQGTQAPLSISDGIEYLNNWIDTDGQKLDVIIVARGGGSFEDLLAYSSVEVIESIHKSNIFIISAVGHEIDFMISDFVADLRAPTPSVSGEIVTTQSKLNIDEYQKSKTFINSHMIQLINTKLSTQKTRLLLFNKILASKNPLIKINEHILSINNIASKLNAHIENKLYKLKTKLELLKIKLDNNDINKILKKGYVILLDNDVVINSINDINSKNLKLKMYDGEVSIGIL